MNETPVEVNTLKQKVIEAISSCYDPEIPVNIYELGLIYQIEIDEQKNVAIQMTLTSPMCPVAGELPRQVQNKVMELEGIGEVKVDLVWEPPWGPERMSEAAKLKLNVPL